MKMQANLKKYLSFFIVFTLLFFSMTSVGSLRVDAASKKSIHSVAIMQSGKNVTKKTLHMRAGASKQLKVKTSLSISKKHIKFESSNKKVVTINKNGKLVAKKFGSAKIIVTVSKNGYKKAKAWVKISVQENEDTAEEFPATQPDEIGTPEDGNADDRKLLVAYFSWSGTSERIAKNIIAQTGADYFRIERETPYDTDYNTVAYGEAKTEADTNSRPPIKEPLESIENYDKIILCYPIWWHTAPMTVGTFLESYDFTGKTIYPISQSASMNISQYDESIAFIKECAKGSVVDSGLFTKDNDEVKAYIENKILQQ